MTVRLNSPLYEDGPWLKEPLKPHLFRHDELGTPAQSTRLTDMPSQKSARGGSRRIDPSPSITSVHKAGRKSK